jgi:hypothetical protein
LVKRRSGELVGFLCAAMLPGTSLFRTYAIDARGYSVVVACVTFALVCSERLPSPGWAVLFALGLLLAESFRYYAIFSMIPFGISEAALLYSTRRFAGRFGAHWRWQACQFWFSGANFLA